MVVAHGLLDGKLRSLTDYTLLVEETAEVQLPIVAAPPPTRSELRAICDAHATKDEIVPALDGV